MKIQPIDSNIVVAPMAVRTHADSPGTFNLSEGHDNPKEADTDLSDQSQNQAKRPKEPEQAISSRQLIEVRGNPGATAQNAAQVRRELSPPNNPYPSVSDLVRANKALDMERAARKQMKSSKQPGADHRA